MPIPYEEINLVSRYWSWGFTEALITVTATWGWPAIPSKVKMAALIIGKDILKQRDVNSGVAGFGEFGAVRVRQNPIAVGMLERLRRYEAGPRISAA